MNLYYFFLFKKKTAYEMRLSDWSSDVCSSDLKGPVQNEPRMPPVPPKSPRAATAIAELPPIPGVKVGAVNCGIRYQGRDDLFMAELDPGTTVAGVFTRPRTASAPVLWCRREIGRAACRERVCQHV